MNVMGKGRVRRDWRAVFGEFERSGLTIKAFCRREGIAPSLFYRHRRRLPAVAASEKPRVGGCDFLELAGISPPSRPIAIAFGNGITLSVGNDCDPDLLGRILSQLQA